MDADSFSNAPAGGPLSSPDSASFAALASAPAGATPCIPRIRKYFVVVADYGTDDPADLIEVVLAEPLSEAQVAALITGLPASTIAHLPAAARHRMFELIGQGVDVVEARDEASALAEARPH